MGNTGLQYDVWTGISAWVRGCMLQCIMGLNSHQALVGVGDAATISITYALSLYLEVLVPKKVIVSLV